MTYQRDTFLLLFGSLISNVLKIKPNNKLKKKSLNHNLLGSIY